MNECSGVVFQDIFGLGRLRKVAVLIGCHFLVGPGTVEEYECDQWLQRVSYGVRERKRKGGAVTDQVSRMS